MKNKFVKNILTVVAILSIMSLGLTGFTTSSTGTQTKKIKITIATAGMPKPFTYVDDNNELTGYDIEVAKAVFALLPRYEVKFEKTEFPSVLAGLDSDRYQVGANDFAMNEARKQKYIYTDPIFKNQYVIVTATSRSDINSFKDLLGKTTEVTPGVNYTTTLEKYNKSHPDKPVKLSYTDTDLLPILQHVESGKFDFQLIDGAMVRQYIKQYGLKLKVVPLAKSDSDLIGTPYSYFLVSKGPNGRQLANDINIALSKATTKGIISKISLKYFDGDFSPKSK